MYGIFTYILLFLKVTYGFHVGQYPIHGWYGSCMFPRVFFSGNQKWLGYEEFVKFYSSPRLREKMGKKHERIQVSQEQKKPNRILEV